jgi:dihydrofolate synthase/folylpolyglutamate synthase
VNIIDADVVLLTSIGIDHEEWLGDSREAIGREKAGVMRSGRPAVIADPDPPESVLAYAESLSVDLRVIGRDFGFVESSSGWSWRTDGAQMEDLPLPPLGGAHQLQNAAGVLQAVHLIAERLPVGESAIRAGLSGARLAGRFQVMPGDNPIVIDVAHNVQAVGVLAAQLREQFPGRAIHAVFALMRDKDQAGVVAQMKDVVTAWYLPRLQVTRAATPERLRDVLRSSGVEQVEWGFSRVSDAVAAASAAAVVGDPIVVFGSFFLVAEYLAQDGGSSG